MFIRSVAEQANDGYALLYHTCSVAVACLALLAIMLAGAVHAEPIGPAVTAEVSGNSVTVSLKLVLSENVTLLPTVQASLVGSNATAVETSIQNAFDRNVQGAHIDSFQLSIWSGNVSSHMMELRENYSITVGGATTTHGDILATNLSFLSMNMSSSISVSGVEINNVGATYLLAGISLIPQGRTAYIINGNSFTKPIVPEQVTSHFNILDLSWIPPVASWTNTFDPFGSSTTWTVKLGGPYNFTAGLSSPENTLLKNWIAVLDPTLEVIAPPRAHANGMIISYERPSSLEVLMPIIVVVVASTATFASVVDWRLTRVEHKKKKK